MPRGQRADREGASAQQGEEWERWNTHFSTIVNLELFGHHWALAQDPNSQHLGSTVWDASIVFAKYLEQNARKGPLSRQHVAKRQCIDLGSGMGLAGLAMAALGCHVTLTDTAEVLPLLRLNAERNLSPAALQGNAVPWAADAGRAEVRELDWLQPDQLAGFQPVDFILATDCVYNEDLTPHLLRTVLHLATEKTVVVVCNELRSHSVHSSFQEAFQPHFSFKKVPHSKHDPVYQHSSIDLLLLKRKKGQLPAPDPESK